MSPSSIYIAVSILVLALIAAFFLYARKKNPQKRLTPLAGLAFGLILAGLFWSDNRLVGYSLLALGVILALIDMFIKSKRP